MFYCLKHYILNFNPIMILLRRLGATALALLLILRFVSTVSSLAIPHGNSQNTIETLTTRGLLPSPKGLEAIRRLREATNKTHSSPSPSPKPEASSLETIHARELYSDDVFFTPACPTHGGLPTIADVKKYITYLRAEEVSRQTCEPHSQEWYWCRQPQQEGRFGPWKMNPSGRWGVLLCRKNDKHAVFPGEGEYLSVVGAVEGFPCARVAEYLEGWIEGCAKGAEEAKKEGATECTRTKVCLQRK